MFTRSSRFGALVLLGCVAVTGLSASAAVLTVGVSNSTGGVGVNLNDAGTLDWAIYDSGASSTTSIAPTNYKSGSTVLQAVTLSSATATQNVRGTGTNGAALYTYEGGAKSPFSQTAARIAEVFDADLDTVGEGVKFTLPPGDPTQLRSVKVYATGFAGIGTLTASLNGVTDQSASTQLFGQGKDLSVFTITYQPDSAGDSLSVKYVLSGRNTPAPNGSTHVGIQAIAISVPEAGTAMGLIAGLSLLLSRRRR